MHGSGRGGGQGPRSLYRLQPQMFVKLVLKYNIYLFY